MYARTIDAALVPGKADEAIEIFRDKVAPIVKEQPGFVSTAIYIDRENNTARTVSIWESKEHESSTAEGTDYLTKVSGLMRGCLVNKEWRHFEVGYFQQ